MCNVSCILCLQSGDLEKDGGAATDGGSKYNPYGPKLPPPSPPSPYLPPLYSPSPPPPYPSPQYY